MVALIMEVCLVGVNIDDFDVRFFLGFKEVKASATFYACGFHWFLQVMLV